MDSSFDLATTYLHLHDGHAERMDVDEHFWPEVISGARPLPGWLVASFDFPAATDTSAPGNSEVHPKGDEVHVCVDGAMRAVLEHERGDEVIDFGAGESCRVPSGVWHRLVARQPSRIVSITFGEGTEHRAGR